MLDQPGMRREVGEQVGDKDYLPKELTLKTEQEGMEAEQHSECGERIFGFNLICII